MTKFLSVFAVLFAFGASAQTDTLNTFFNFNSTELIQSPNGGYVSGNNGYGDKEKLQAFIPDTNYSVLGALVWMGNIKRNVANPSNSKVWLKMRRFDVSPVATIPFVGGPKEVLDSVSIALDSLRADSTYEAGWNYIPFNAPVFAGQPYGISLSFENLEPGDTCAIRHSAEDSVLGAGNSWEIWNGSWRRMIDNWGLNIDFAIFPVIDTSLNAITMLDRIDLDIYPNPTADVLNIVLPETVIGGEVQIAAYTTGGQLAFKTDRLIDESRITIDAKSLQSGAYTLVIFCKNWRGCAHVIVKH
ncbi:MAG: T9SS type A sorting domain-containing protein [Bacteroidia bacterium]